MSQTQAPQLEHEDSIETQDPNNREQAWPTKSRRPANTAFKQQRLKAWQPILTPKTVLPLLFVVGVIFAPIGGLLIWASSLVQELQIDYSDCNTTAPAYPTYSAIPSSKVTSYFKNTTDPANAPQWSREETTQTYGVDGSQKVATPICHLRFYIPDTIGPPVLLYYVMTRFYQNHRRYVKSFDQDQLAGQFRDNKSISNSDCDPLTVDPATNKSYYPCGVIANSVFNDTFYSPVALNWPGASTNSTAYNMTTDGTAWSSDAELYKPTVYTYDEVVPPPNWRAQYPEYSDNFPFPALHTDDAFQVWMRTAGLPTFSKLKLRNDSTAMQIGTYDMEIWDYFPVTIYDGTKSILISTRTVMGGRNPFLGIAYVVVGGICIVLGAIFTATHFIKPRKLGDHTYLSWNNDQPSTATTTGRAPRPNEAA